MPPMRLQRALARAGITSRRKAEELIQAGRVTVNGAVASIGQSVDASRDVIAVDGTRVKAPAAHVWLALNKPPGVVTSAADERGRRTVFDVIGRKIPGLTYAGRLDYLTEGLLLLTTDGEAVHRLTHPSSEVERVYVATVTGDGHQAAVQLRRGVELDGEMVRPLEVVATHVARGRWDLQITISEGKNREIRRLCEAVELEIERLVRIQFGPIKLGRLAVGGSRPLTARELSMIDAVGMRPKEH